MNYTNITLIALGILGILLHNLVEQLVRKLMKEYGFNQIIRDHDLTLSEVIQVLHDHGYIDLCRYEEEDR